MPIYEFRCAKCRRKTSVFVRGFTVNGPVACGACGSTETARVFSTFAVGKSSQPDLQKMADDLSAVNYNDPRAMARQMREANAELPPDAEFDEMLDHMDRGEVPDEDTFYDVMSGGIEHNREDTAKDAEKSGGDAAS